jgi:hypothetical protein
MLRRTLRVTASILGWGLRCVLSLLLLVCLFLAVLPLFTRTARFRDLVSGRASAALGGARVTIGRLRLAPVSGRPVAIHDLSVTPPGANEPLLELGTFSVRYRPLRALAREAVLDELLVRDLRVRVVSDETGWNFRDLLPAPSAPAPEKPPEEPGKPEAPRKAPPSPSDLFETIRALRLPLAVRVSRIRLENLSVSVAQGDRLRLDLDGFSADFACDFNREAAGRLDLRVRLDSLEAALDDKAVRIGKPTELSAALTRDTDGRLALTTQLTVPPPHARTGATGPLNLPGLHVSLTSALDPGKERVEIDKLDLRLPGLLRAGLSDVSADKLGRGGFAATAELELSLDAVRSLIPAPMLKDIPLPTPPAPPSLPPAVLAVLGPLRANALEPAGPVLGVPRQNWADVDLAAFRGRVRSRTTVNGRLPATDRPPEPVRVSSALNVDLDRFEVNVARKAAVTGEADRLVVQRAGTLVDDFRTDLDLDASLDVARRRPETLKLAGTLAAARAIEAALDGHRLAIRDLRCAAEAGVSDFPRIVAHVPSFELHVGEIHVLAPGLADVRLPFDLTARLDASHLSRPPESAVSDLDVRIRVGKLVPSLTLAGDIDGLGKRRLDLDAGLKLDLGQALALAGGLAEPRIADLISRVGLEGTFASTVKLGGALPSPDAPERALTTALTLNTGLRDVRARIAPLDLTCTRLQTSLQANATLAGAWQPRDVNVSVRTQIGPTEAPGLVKLAAADLQLKAGAADRQLSRFSFGTQFRLEGLRAGRRTREGPQWIHDPLDLNLKLDTSGRLPEGDLDIPAFSIEAPGILALHLREVEVRDRGAGAVSANLSVQLPDLAALSRLASSAAPAPLPALSGAAGVDLTLRGKAPLAADFIKPGLRGLKKEKPDLALWPPRDFVRDKLSVETRLNVRVRDFAVALPPVPDPAAPDETLERGISGLGLDVSAGFAPRKIDLSTRLGIAEARLLPELGPIRDVSFAFGAVLDDWDALRMDGPDLSARGKPFATRVSARLYGLSRILQSDPRTQPIDHVLENLGLEFTSALDVRVPETLLPPGLLVKGAVGFDTRLAMIPAERMRAGFDLRMEGLSVAAGNAKLLQLLHKDDAFALLADRGQLTAALDKKSLLRCFRPERVLSILDAGRLVREASHPIELPPEAIQGVHLPDPANPVFLDLAESRPALRELPQELSVPPLATRWFPPPVSLVAAGGPDLERLQAKLARISPVELALNPRRIAAVLSPDELLDLADDSRLLDTLAWRRQTNLLHSRQALLELLKEPYLFIRVADRDRLIKHLRKNRRLLYALDAPLLLSVLPDEKLLPLVDGQKLADLVNSQLRVVSDLRGRIPLTRTLALSTLATRRALALSGPVLSETVLEEEPAPTEGIDPYVNGVTVSSAIAGYDRAANGLRIDRVVAPPAPVIRQMQFVLRLDESRVVLDRLRFQTLDGKVHGQLTLLPVADVYRLHFWLEFTNLDFRRLLPERLQGLGEADARVSGNAEITLTVRERTYAADSVPLDDIDVRLFITRVGSAALDRLLLSFDPNAANPGLVSLRGKLKLARPKRVSVVLKRGLADVDVEFEGLAAQFVERQSVRYIPVATLLQQESLRKALSGLSSLQGLLQKLSASTLVIEDDHKTIRFR